MIRLILIAAFIAVLAIAVTAALGTVRVLADVDHERDDGMLPGRLNRITYVLLLILLFGVASGLLGAA